MSQNALLVFVTFNLLGGFDATLSSCCHNKTVGEISYTLVKEGPTSQYGCTADCLYHPAGKPQDRVCFRPGALETTCKPGETDEIDDMGGIGGTDTTDRYKRNRENTTIILALAQSMLFANLSENQQRAFFNVSKANGLEEDPSCDLDKLAECNKDQFAMQKCSSSDGTEEFFACAASICPTCSCSLTDLLGLQCEQEQTVRFLAGSGEEFINVYSSLHAFDQDENSTSFYITYNGVLEQTKKEKDLKENLKAHYEHFASMFNWATETEMPAMGMVEGVTEVQAILDVASTMVSIINRTKTIFLGELTDEIQKMNNKIDGLTDEQGMLVENATRLLGQSEINIGLAQANLEVLAHETIQRVDKMLYYISLVKSDWSKEKIAKFLKFHAKIMTQFVDRSLNLLKEATILYKKTQIDLNNIKAQLFSFQNTLEDLANQNSAAYKARVKTYRLAIYIPCCGAAVVGLAVACPICVATLETVIANWRAAMNRMKSLLEYNGKLTEKITTEVDEIQSGLGKDLKLIMTWQGALIAVQDIDYTFPEAEVIGFDASLPPVIDTFNELKTAAQNYLNAHEKQNSPQ